MPDTTLGERVADHLTRRILDGALRPGEHVVTEDLAAELGVSRLPVREALRTLDGQGLIELRPRRGAFVAAVDEASALAEIIETRARLEPWAASRAATTATPEDLDRITAALASGTEALERGARADVGLAHHRFLRALSAAAHHATLDTVLAPLQHRTMLAFGVVRFRVEPGRWADHLAVRDAIAAGDGVRAAALTERHLDDVVRALHTADALVPAHVGGRAPRRGGGRP